MEIIYSLATIEDVVTQVWEIGKNKKVWAFYAKMGSGKTTFIHALCKLLQVEDSVSSPTYAIINEYNSLIEGKIYHSDWYRLKDEEDAINAGVEDMLYSGNLCLVEWPEKAQGLMDNQAFKIYIEVIDEQTRRLYF